MAIDDEGSSFELTIEPKDDLKPGFSRRSGGSDRCRLLVDLAWPDEANEQELPIDAVRTGRSAPRR